MAEVDIEVEGAGDEADLVVEEAEAVVVGEEGATTAAGILTLKIPTLG